MAYPLSYGRSLNPYCNGCTSRCAAEAAEEAAAEGLNPYCNGCTSRCSIYNAVTREEFKS